MAQSGFTPIKLYLSTTAAATPTAGNLEPGELALNNNDGKLFYEDSAGVVQVLATKAGASGDVVGPASATANAIPSFNGTTGKLIQNNSGATISAGVITATGFAGPHNGTVGATTPSTVVATQVDITAQGDLRLQDTTGGEYVALQAPGTLASSYTLTLPVDDGTAGQALITDGSGVLSWSTAASGDVYGPASATDNAIARFDGTTGKIIQNSVVTIADTTGNMAGVGTLGVGAITTSGALTYGGVTLNNAVTGTGNMVLSTSPTLVTPALGTPSSGVVTNLTGTASININGTVGATTPAAGAFTTFTTSSNAVISDNSANAALRITQVGAGNALLVEDSANPDATPFVIDASGKVAIGATTTVENLSIVSDGRNFLQLTRASTDALQSVVSFRKARGTNAAPTIVASGDSIGDLQYFGYDGANYVGLAAITAGVDGTPGTNDMPGRLVFSTTADGASSSTERMRINSAGEIGIGVASTTAYSIRSAKNVTGAVTTYGIVQQGTVQSDNTTTHNAFLSNPATQATAFTLTNLRHYTASQGTIGATSVVTNQYGVFVDSTLTGATNNYGFFGNIASSTGRFNFYAAGTAANVFAGTTSIGGLVGSESLRVTPVASAVNYWNFQGASTGNSISFGAAGSDTNIDVTNFSKGAAGHLWYTNGSALQFYVAPTASAVNYLQVTGAATAGSPSITAQGSDTNVGLNFSSKGTGNIVFYANSLASVQFAIGYTTSTVNYLRVDGGATGSAAALVAAGSDTNINIALTPKGAGLLTLGDSTLPAGTSTLLNALFSSDTAVGNVFSVRKSAATTAGANIGLFRSRGTAAAPTALASGDNINSFISSGFDGTNYLTAASIIGGVDSAVSAGVMPGRISFLTSSGATNTERGRVDSIGNWYFAGSPGANSLRVAVVASAVNYVDVQGAATGVSPVIQAAGSDTNIDLALTPKGTGVLAFGTYTAGIIAQAGYITIKDAGGTTRRLLVG